MRAKKGYVFMRIGMLALVLVAASAVVLIFANTLNSWVLGGLIGGLAALLISIPISLVIFSSLARRHDERLYAQMVAQEEAAMEGADNYEYAEVYETEAYVMPGEDEEYEEYYDEDAYYEDRYRRYENPRLDRAAEVRRLPAPGQRQEYYAQDYRRTTRDLAQQPLQERTQAVRSQQPRQNNRQTGHQRQARTPQTTRSLRSMQHAAALRAAMREAEQEHVENSGFTVAPRRAPTPRRLPSQEAMQRRPTTSGNLNGDSINAYQHGRGADPRTDAVQTDQLSGYNATMRQNPETGKIMRNPQLGEVYDPSESWADSLNTPIVRRAPYLYEDDALHEHFAQQVEKPIARRASRYLQPLEEEE